MKPYDKLTADEKAAYEQGYEDGESNQLADWQFALDDLLPDDIKVRPSTVAEFIRSLTDVHGTPEPPANNQALRQQAGQEEE